jgi:hypothetical protein
MIKIALLPRKGEGKSKAFKQNTKFNGENLSKPNPTKTL